MKIDGYTERWFDRLVDDITIVVDDPNTLTSTAARRLLSRIQDDVLEFREAVKEARYLNEKVQRLQADLEFAYGERNQLKEQVSKLTSGALRNGVHAARISEAEKVKLDEEKQLDQFLYFLSENQLINAIKLWRRVFNSGLSDSKRRVEQIRDGSF